MVCQHDVNKENSSVLQPTKKFFICPECFSAVCLCCGKVFTYIKNSEGIFVRKEEEKDENIRRDV